MMVEKSESLLRNMNGVRLHVLNGGHADGAQEWAASVANPPYTRLYYICGGDAYVTAEGRVTPLEAGRCYLLPTGFSFEYACRTRMEQLFFHVRLLDDTGTDLLRACSGILQSEPGEDQIRRLIALTMDDRLSAGLRLQQELCEAVLDLLEQGGVPLGRTQYSRCVRDAIAQIGNRLSMQLTVGELAAGAHVSESTLEKTFRAQTGMTIGRYIDEAVFFKAEELLRHTDLSVAQISDELGFCDQFYFSRRFRRRYGMPPHRYRKAYPI